MRSYKSSKQKDAELHEPNSKISLAVKLSNLIAINVKTCMTSCHFSRLNLSSTYIFEFISCNSEKEK